METLLRDRDAIFADAFRGRLRDMGIQEVLCTPRSPWQRAYIERVIASIRRECRTMCSCSKKRPSVVSFVRIWITITDREPISP